MHDLTAFQRDCLYVIAGLDEPMGLSIKAELDEYYAGEINHARLYPNLTELVENGLVEKAQRDGRTNAYTLTDRADRKLEARRAWEEETVTS